MSWLIGGLLLSAVSIWTAVFTLPDDYLHVVFCDVGQGDAILISHKTTQMLVDGGPNNQVLACLSAHMPFYDHQLESVMMTHPDADHATGLVDVFSRYSVTTFIRSDVAKDTQVYKRLLELTQQVPTTYVTTGDVIKVGEQIKMTVVWPTPDWQSQEVNTHSIVGILSRGSVDFLLTGDADSQVDLAIIATGLLRGVEILKVPHHGSKTAMLDDWLDLVSPELSVIQVGKNNRYDHPRQEPLDQLTRLGSKIFRTDIHGDIEVITDGQKWWYNLEHAN